MVEILFISSAYPLFGTILLQSSTISSVCIYIDTFYFIKSFICDMLMSRVLFRQWGFEYTDCIPCRGLSPSSKKGDQAASDDEVSVLKFLGVWSTSSLPLFAEWFYCSHGTKSSLSSMTTTCVSKKFVYQFPLCPHCVWKIHK